MFSKIKHLALQSKKPSLKVILLGDSGVGKTTTLLSLFGFHKDNSNYIHNSTIFINSFTDIYNDDFDLIYYDTAGQERFNSLTPSYFRDVDIVLLVFDITNLYTYQNVLNNWLELFREHYPDNKAKIFLIANKIDLLKTEIDFQKLNDPQLYAIEHNIILKCIHKNDHKLYEELKKDIIESAYEIIKWKKEHEPKYTDYFKYLYWFPSRSEDRVEEDDDKFEKIYESFYEQEFQSKEEGNNCCNIS